MMIEVHLFARARDLAGTDRLSVELPENAVVGDLRRRLAELYPNLGRLLERSALAVDNELAGDAVPLSPSAEVALLPPVSGG
jgi:molybdopterin converting factor subunit 1